MAKKKQSNNQPPNVEAVEEAVQKLQDLTIYVQANLKSIVLVLNHELNLHLETTGLSAHEAENVTRVPTPIGEAKARPAAGEIPPPKNGHSYTAEELENPGTFTRPVLAKILEQLGGNSKGMMPPDLRTAILEVDAPANLGTCDFTGCEGIAIIVIEVDGDEYNCGPAVRKLWEKKKARTAKARAKIVAKLVNEELSV